MNAGVDVSKIAPGDTVGLRAAEDLRALLSALELGRLDAEAGGWRPIESAPRDSESILLGWAGGPCVEIGYWHYRRFVWDSAFETGTIDEQPTHWRPLPAPPTGEGGGL